MEAVAVDVARGNDAHRYLCRGAQHGSQQHLSHLRVDLLRVVQKRQRPDAVPLQQLVVEEDAGDDERACQRAPPRLVRARDEADSETAVEAKQALTRRGAHCPRISPDPERARAGLVPTL